MVLITLALGPGELFANPLSSDRPWLTRFVLRAYDESRFPREASPVQGFVLAAVIMRLPSAPIDIGVAVGEPVANKTPGRFRPWPGSPIRRLLGAALALLFLIPVAHQIWDADAPGRCIRTLMAFDRPEHEDPLHALTSQFAKAATPDGCPCEEAVIEEFDETDEIAPNLAALPLPAPPTLPGFRPSRPALLSTPTFAYQRLRC